MVLLMLRYQVQTTRPAHVVVNKRFQLGGLGISPNAAPVDETPDPAWKLACMPTKFG